MGYSPVVYRRLSFSILYTIKDGFTAVIVNTEKQCENLKDVEDLQTTTRKTKLSLLHR